MFFIFDSKTVSLFHLNSDYKYLFSKINRVKTKSNNIETVTATVSTSELIFSFNNNIGTISIALSKHQVTCLFV